MDLASDRCVCLRKVEFSETSQILDLFSEKHGIVSVLAKGAHRVTKAGSGRFDGGIDLLDLGMGVFTDDPARQLGQLTEWKLESGHPPLRRTLRGLRLAVYAAELISALIETHDPHPELFRQFVHLLDELATPRLEQAMLAWQLDLLTASGHLPAFDACVGCGKQAGDSKTYFSPARGGIVCQNCEQAIPDRQWIDPRLVRLVQQIIRLSRDNGSRRLPQLTRVQTDPINRILAEHVVYVIGRPLRAWPYVSNQGP